MSPDHEFRFDALCDLTFEFFKNYFLREKSPGIYYEPRRMLGDDRIWLGRTDVDEEEDGPLRIESWIFAPDAGKQPFVVDGQLFPWLNRLFAQMREELYEIKSEQRHVANFRFELLGQLTVVLIGDHYVPGAALYYERLPEELLDRAYQIPLVLNAAIGIVHARDRRPKPSLLV